MWVANIEDVFIYLFILFYFYCRELTFIFALFKHIIGRSPWPAEDQLLAGSIKPV